MRWDWLLIWLAIPVVVVGSIFLVDWVRTRHYRGRHKK